MKYWLSHLPLEVWVEVFSFPWISRRKLGRIVDRFGNRKFVEYLQFYLHDWGKRKLDGLHFDKDGLYKYVDYQPYCLYLDIPLAPIPDNFKCFTSITINHFDAQTVAFLRQLKPLFVDLKLGLHGFENAENTRTILTHLLPLLDGGSIHSMAFDVRALPAIRQLFGEQLARLKVLTIFYNAGDGVQWALAQATINFVMDWLLNPPAHVGPRLCEVNTHGDDGQFLGHISVGIREQFLAAKTPCPFALIIHLVCWKQPGFPEFHLENAIGEQLHGEHIGNERFQITRHQTVAKSGTELQAVISRNDWAKRHSNRQNLIAIHRPTLGPF